MISQKNFSFYENKETLKNERFNSDPLSTPRSLDSFIREDYSPYQNQSLNNFIISNYKIDQIYSVTPLPENVVAGKNSYTYDAHTYHTKVPPEAIIRLIEHYTESGDLVLDPFCGSGMTGVAALRSERKPILIDLSPAASFIAYNFLTPIDSQKYMQAIQTALQDLHKEELALYGTHCRKCGKLVPMDYMVWSYGLICEHCGKEFVLWDVARDEKEDNRESKIKSDFDCPYCGKYLKKRVLKRTKLYPVEVGYHCCGSKLKESRTVLDEYDLNLLKTLDDKDIFGDLWYPTAKLPNGVNTKQVISHGFKSVDDLYTKRNLKAMALLWDIARRWQDNQVSLKLMFTITSLYQRVTRLSEFRFWGGSGNIANYNVPMIFNEQNVFKVFNRKAKTIRDYLGTWTKVPDEPFCISTQSATDLHFIPNDSIDYIFTDPPFGKNINYSEMNFIWESWLGIYTIIKEEAIINSVQGKTIEDYRTLMTDAFMEMYRVLKPDRWLTVAFHNSSSEVWSSIQNALLHSGFCIERIQTLDKKHGTFKQFVSENAVGYDLMIHCIKDMHHKYNENIHPKNGTTNEAIISFLDRTLRKNPDEYITKYLHVKRNDELDIRKLYSLWLKEKLESQESIDLDSEKFRHIICQIIQSEYKNILK